MSLAFDIFVFFSMLGYTIQAMKASRRSHILRALVRDGTLYFLMVLAQEVVWILLIKYGRVSLRLFSATGC